MESIEIGILGKPYIFATIVFFMSIFDDFLPKISRELYHRGHNKFFVYLGVNISFYAGSWWAKWGIRLLIPVMLVLIYNLAELSEDRASMDIYQMFAGFAFFNYLIINLRHLQNILLYNLTRDDSKDINYMDLDGEVIIGSRYSLRQSAVQIFTIALLFFGIFVFQPNFFLAGGILAPIFLTIRNLILSGIFRDRKSRN